MTGHVPGYVSKLDAVFRIRCYREEAAQHAFTIAKDGLTEEEDRLMGVQGVLSRAARDLEARQGNGITANEMELYYDFFRGQYIQADARKKTIEVLGDVCEKKRVVLAQAVRERDVVERIEEGRKVLYIREVGKKEQGVVDEVAGRRPLLGGLVTLAIAVFFSGISYAQPVTAKEGETNAAPSAATSPANASPPAISIDPHTPTALIKAVEKRTAELDERQAHLETREQQLKLMEQEVSEMLGRNTKLREEIEQKQVQISAENEQKLQTLSKTYAAMPAEEAALRLEQMEESLALNILTRSKPKIAAKFLASMKPEKAAKLSQKFAKPQ
jgi:flagellar export protein FliJ